MAAKKGTKTKEIRYIDAMSELEQILEELDGDAVDVDQLAAQVKRASELIRLCRERLGATQLEIERVVAEVEPEGAGDAAEGA